MSGVAASREREKDRGLAEIDACLVHYAGPRRYSRISVCDKLGHDEPVNEIMGYMVNPVIFLPLSGPLSLGLAVAVVIICCHPPKPRQSGSGLYACIASLTYNLTGTKV